MLSLYVSCTDGSFVLCGMCCMLLECGGWYCVIISVCLGLALYVTMDMGMGLVVVVVMAVAVAQRLWLHCCIVVAAVVTLCWGGQRVSAADMVWRGVGCATGGQ